MKTNTIKSRLLVGVAILAMLTMVGAASAASTSFNIVGYGANIGGGGKLSTGWANGNFGNSWVEGDWVPVMLEITNVQSTFPNLVGFPTLNISWDFHGSSGSKNAIFVDLVRDIQVGTTILNNSQGWPTASGAGQPITLGGVFAGQTDPAEHLWPGFAFFNLPNRQVNINLDGSQDIAPGSATHQFSVTVNNITSNGISKSADTIVIYFQAHLSKNFVWSNNFQSQYATNAITSTWGGYLYNTDNWTTITPPLQGSGFFPGSSTHVTLSFGVGSQSLPMPLPPTPTGVITGQKFFDNPPIGTINGQDTPLSGWRIFINTSLLGEPVIFGTSVLTDSNGAYNFSNLDVSVIPGFNLTYNISESSQRDVPPQVGYVQSFPFSGVVGAIPISLAGEGPFGWAVNLSNTVPTVSNINFANFQTGSISGLKFNDTNGNHVFDSGESTLPGWTINLANNSGIINTTITDSNGNYSFNNLLPGNYTVSEILQSGWIQTFPLSGIWQIALQPGQNDTNVNFGNFLNGSLSGIKFNDINGNGKLDNGEPGLGNWTIILDGTDTITNTSIHLTTVTAPDGSFSFTNLTNGTYTLSEVLQNGWINTLTPPPVEIRSGTNSTNNNFGNFQLGSISGMKFNDLNDNGTLDAGEPGLANWTIVLDGTDTITNTTVHNTSITDSNGNFTFTNLTNGTYTLTEQLQPGWIQTAPATGSIVVNVQSGTVSTGNNFGNFQLRHLSFVKAGSLNMSDDNVIDYTINATNDGFAPLDIISITDPNDPNIGSTCTPAFLAPGQSTVCKTSYSVKTQIPNINAPTVVQFRVNGTTANINMTI